jgi:hypothetical protein
MILRAIKTETSDSAVHEVGLGEEREFATHHHLPRFVCLAL